MACKWRATYRWKVIDEGYNFSSDLIPIGSLHKKLQGSKITRVLTLVISRLPFGNPEIKCHLDVGLVEKHIMFYKEEGGGFPQVRVVVSCMSPRLLMVYPSTKSVQNMH
jgi:hypothetical protein